MSFLRYSGYIVSAPTVAVCMGVEMMNFDPLAIEVDVAPGLEERLTRPELRRKPPRACYARRELHILMRGYVHNTREGTVPLPPSTSR